MSEQVINPVRSGVVREVEKKDPATGVTVTENVLLIDEKDLPEYEDGVATEIYISSDRDVINKYSKLYTIKSNKHHESTILSTNLAVFSLMFLAMYILSKKIKG